jgi:hypothetical protein
VVYGLAIAAATESGLLFAIDAKARAGGFPLQLLLDCFVAKGHTVVSRRILLKELTHDGKPSPS